MMDDMNRWIKYGRIEDSEKCREFKGERCDRYCDTCVDERDIECVCEYASTCDYCGELTAHSDMAMDADQLGYCISCTQQLGVVGL